MTDSDIPRGGADSAVHSAVQSPSPAGSGAYAQARARAREATPQAVHPQPDEAPSVTVTWSEHLADLKAAWMPPDIWRQPRPGLADRWAYATCSKEWTGDGYLRKAGQAYAIAIALPAAAVLLLADWIVERPSRLAAATVLIALLAQFPPLSWLI